MQLVLQSHISSCCQLKSNLIQKGLEMKIVRLIFQTLKIVLIVIFCGALLFYLIFPEGLTTRGYWTPAWWQKSLFNFCTYEVPDNYEVVLYAEGAPNHREDNYVIILKEQKTGQLIILSRLKGFHHIPFDSIRTINREFRRSLSLERNHVLGEFKIITHMPIWHFLRQDDQEKLPSNLILRGMNVKRKNTYETSSAHVYYLNGTFQKIGFFKKMPLPWGFATPVFEFVRPSHGALAILNNKDAEETIIVASAVPTYRKFNEDVLKTFIDSISFEKNIYKPALLEGLKEEPKPKVKFGF
jgi:hypothetical protein